MVNKYVLDTNVLISALFNDKSLPALALKKARLEGILLVSEEIAAEYLEVFSRNKFDKYLPKAYRLAFIDNIVSCSLPIIIEMSITACRDPRDDKFLSLAVAGKAKYIISGDADLLALNPFIGINILKPADFLAARL